MIMPYFDQVKRFCLFAASPRSGHSIMGHLLTAHPKVMISDELAAIGFFQEGYIHVNRYLPLLNTRTGDIKGGIAKKESITIR